MIKGDKVCITILINNVNALEVEKKREFSNEGRALLNELEILLNTDSIKDLRIINKYDIE